jgi:hypothetical protein
MSEQDERLHTEDIARASEPTRGRRDEADERRGDTPTASPGWSSLIGNSEDLAVRWDAIQASFVDEPRHAVEEADALVAEAIRRIADSFSEERSRLESQWSQGDEVDTEDLRITLQRYRTFFNQLLAR